MSTDVILRWEGPWPSMGSTALGKGCPAGHFTFSIWVKKIGLFHTPQIPKAKYLLSALPFPSQAERRQCLAPGEGEGSPCREVRWASPLSFPLSSAARSPVCYGRSQAGFLETGGKTQESCLRPPWAAIGPHVVRLLAESWKRRREGGRHWASFWDFQPPGQQDPEA